MRDVSNEATSLVRQELLTAREVAQVLGVSTRTVYRDLSAGKLLLPIRLGNKPRWRRTELMDWIKLGCPPVEGDDE